MLRVTLSASKGARVPTCNRKSEKQTLVIAHLKLVLHEHRHPVQRHITTKNTPVLSGRVMHSAHLYGQQVLHEHRHPVQRHEELHHKLLRVLLRVVVGLCVCVCVYWERFNAEKG